MERHVGTWFQGTRKTEETSLAFFFPNEKDMPVGIAADDDDVGASPGQSGGYSKPYSAAAAGYQVRPVGEGEVHEMDTARWDAR